MRKKAEGGAGGGGVGGGAAGGRPGLRARNKLAKRGRIIEAARALFREKGFEAATTREIAERAEVGAGTLFLYARNKSDLLVLVYWESIRDTVREAFTTLPAGAPLAEELMHVFTRLFEMYSRDEDLSRAYIREMIFQPGESRREMDELTVLFFRTASERAEAARARGEVGEHFDAGLAAQNFFGLYFFALTMWLGGWVDRETALAHLRDAVGLQIEGLRPRAPAARPKGGRGKGGGGKGGGRAARG